MNNIAKSCLNGLIARLLDSSVFVHQVAAYRQHRVVWEVASGIRSMGSGETSLIDRVKFLEVAFSEVRKLVRGVAASANIIMPNRHDEQLGDFSRFTTEENNGVGWLGQPYDVPLAPLDGATLAEWVNSFKDTVGRIQFTIGGTNNEFRRPCPAGICGVASSSVLTYRLNRLADGMKSGAPLTSTGELIGSGNVLFDMPTGLTSDEVRSLVLDMIDLLNMDMYALNEHLSDMSRHQEAFGWLSGNIRQLLRHAPSRGREEIKSGLVLARAKTGYVGTMNMAFDALVMDNTRVTSLIETGGLTIQDVQSEQNPMPPSRILTYYVPDATRGGAGVPLYFSGSCGLTSGIGAAFARALRSVDVLNSDEERRVCNGVSIRDALLRQPNSLANAHMLTHHPIASSPMRVFPVPMAITSGSFTLIRHVPLITVRSRAEEDDTAAPVISPATADNPYIGIQVRTQWGTRAILSSSAIYHAREMVRNSHFLATEWPYLPMFGRRDSNDRANVILGTVRFASISGTSTEASGRKNPFRHNSSYAAYFTGHYASSLLGNILRLGARPTLDRFLRPSLGDDGETSSGAYDAISQLTEAFRSVEDSYSDRPVPEPVVVDPPRPRWSTARSRFRSRGLSIHHYHGRSRPNILVRPPSTRVRDYLQPLLDYTIGFEVEKDYAINSDSSVASMPGDYVDDTALFAYWERDGSCGVEGVTHAYSLAGFPLFRKHVRSADHLLRSPTIGLRSYIRGRDESRFGTNIRRYSCGGHVTLVGPRDKVTMDSVRRYSGLIYSLYRPRLRNGFCGANKDLQSSGQDIHYAGIRERGPGSIEFRIIRRVMGPHHLLWRFRFFQKFALAIHHDKSFDEFIRHCRPLLNEVYEPADRREVECFAKLFDDYLQRGVADSRLLTYL